MAYKKLHAQFHHVTAQESRIDASAFALRTSEALFWLGWLCANVHLRPHTGYGWQATVYVNDVVAPDGSHPYKIQFQRLMYFLGMKNTITISPPNHMVVRSTTLARLLIETYRIQPETFSVPTLYTVESAFWCGYIEQNGNIVVASPHWYLDVQGSHTLLRRLCEYAGEILCPQDCISDILTGKHTCEISFTDQAAGMLLEAIYPQQSGLRNPLFWEKVLLVHERTGFVEKISQV